ncbi:MAG: hypothetical protein E4G96_06210 [Chrysiogenales bacterium]|nr:MAG: hypothetical protein E4G96_06210 [Chrysiogenales bacterium]
MKYTVVKQFSNGVIDNMFAFIFKWVDCGKMFLEFILSFIEIWIAFFMIFYNAFMYVYYLFLFFIDRGTESSGSVFRIRGTYAGTSSIPKFELSRGSSTVPPMYGARQAVESLPKKAADAAMQSFSSLKSSPSRGIKKSFFRELANSMADIFQSLGRLIIAPFKKLVMLFDRGSEIRKLREEDTGKSKSLIDEYMKEYEGKRK